MFEGAAFDVTVDLRKDSPTHMVSGLVRFLARRTRNNFIFPKVLPTDFWYCLILPPSAINARIFTIPATRADLLGTIRKSALNGLI